MIRIINKSLFRFEVIHPKNNTRNISLINIFSEPEDIELNKYSKTPFASIIVYTDVTDTVNMTELFSYLIKGHTTSILSFRPETSDKYDEYKSEFDESVKMCDVLYVTCSLEDLSMKRNYSSEFIVIGGIPITGMVYPISNGKNDAYSIYNGAFIVDNEFEYNGGTFKRLLYISASINSSLVIDEYIKHPDMDCSIGTFIRYEFYVDTYSYFDNIYIAYKRYDRLISKNGRERLFVPSGKNIFPKNNLPPHIKKVNDSITIVDLVKAKIAGKVKLSE